MQRRVVVAAALAVVLCVARGARAETTPERVVIVVACGDDANAARLEAVARELLGRLHVQIEVSRAGHVDPRDVVTPRPEAAPPLARAWLDTSAPALATLYLVDRPWERVLVRHVPRPAGSDEIVRDQLAHILESSIEALLAGARIGLARDEARAQLGVAPAAPAPASPPEQAPAPARPSVRATRRLEVAVAYEGQLYSAASTFAHGPVAAFALAPRPQASRLGALLSVQYRVPVVVDADPVGLRLDTVAPRLVATFDLLARTRLVLRAALGGGADITRVEPHAASGAPVAVRAPYTGASPVVRAAALFEVGLDAGLSLLVAASIESDPTASRFTYDDHGAHRDVLTPFAVRPALAVGLASVP